jgi:hypothetical protein
MSGSGTKLQTITFKEFERFVDGFVQPELRSVARCFWSMVEREASALSPGMRGGTEKYIPIPVWRMERDVMVLSPSAKALTVSFAKGALFDDPKRLLGGAGKVTRTLKLRTEGDVLAVAPFLPQVVKHA